MTKPIARVRADPLPVLEADAFMRRGSNRWDSEFAAHAQEQRRIAGMILGYGPGVPARIFTEDEDDAE